MKKKKLREKIVFIEQSDGSFIVPADIAKAGYERRLLQIRSKKKEKKA